MIPTVGKDEYPPRTAPKVADCRRLLDLKPGWDGYRGKTTTEAALNSVEHIFVVPLNSGGVQVEAHLHGGSVEFEIGPDGALESVCWVKQRA